MPPEFGNERESAKDPRQGGFDRAQMMAWPQVASDTSINLLSCHAAPGKVTIPTQLPGGGTNERDCTAYPERSEQADSYQDMLDSVVKVTGVRQTDGEVRSASGSGFFLTPDGKIATDFHNVRDASNLKVITADGAEMNAKVIGVDRRVDLAILQVEQPQNIYKQKVFSSLVLGSSNILEKGNEVSAWGYPLGLDRLYMSPGGFPAVPGGFQERMSLKEALIRNSLRVEPDSPVDLSSRLMKGENPDRIVFESRIMANRGNSGGPITDKNRQVVGVVGLSNMGNSTMSTPVEDLTRLLAFVNQQQLTSNPRLFFDEADVSPSSRLTDAQQRLVDRGRALESRVAFDSIGKLPSLSKQKYSISLDRFGLLDR
jgi:Trypsin-like serine proteases, typically periplasmic, contain C-terminal PDZ domain